MEQTSSRTFAPAVRKPHGFTLVEILVVVAILGLTSAVLIPQLSTRADIAAAGAARQVMSDIAYAQNLAITSQSPVYVVFSNAAGTGIGGSYSLMRTLPSTVLTHPVNKSAWTVPFGVAGPWQMMRLSGASFDGQRALMFDETGAPISISAAGGTATPLSSGSVGITCNGFTMTVRVEALTGTLSVQ